MQNRNNERKLHNKYLALTNVKPHLSVFMWDNNYCEKKTCWYIANLKTICKLKHVQPLVMQAFEHNHGYGSSILTFSMDP